MSDLQVIKVIYSSSEPKYHLLFGTVATHQVMLFRSCSARNPGLGWRRRLQCLGRAGCLQQPRALHACLVPGLVLPVACKGIVSGLQCFCAGADAAVVGVDRCVGAQQQAVGLVPRRDVLHIYNSLTLATLWTAGRVQVTKLT